MFVIPALNQMFDLQLATKRTKLIRQAFANLFFVTTEAHIFYPNMITRNNILQTIRRKFRETEVYQFQLP